MTWGKSASKSSPRRKTSKGARNERSEKAVTARPLGTVHARREGPLGPAPGRASAPAREFRRDLEGDPARPERRSEGGDRPSAPGQDAQPGCPGGLPRGGREVGATGGGSGRPRAAEGLVDLPDAVRP